MKKKNGKKFWKFDDIKFVRPIQWDDGKRIAVNEYNN